MEACRANVYPCRRYGPDMEACQATSTFVEIWLRHGSVSSNVYCLRRYGPDMEACRASLPLYEIWPRHGSGSSNVYPCRRYCPDMEACRATSILVGDMAQTWKRVEQRLPL